MIGVLILLWSAQGASPPPAEPRQFAQVIIRNQIIIRTIRIGPPPSASSMNMEWKEQKGPKCVQPQAISGAAQVSQRSVDLLLRNGSRIRARLASSCPALDYYDGFYITPGKDGLICSDRESVRSRAGGECEIDSFRALHAVPTRGAEAP
jgi:hypothetical protein